MRNRNVRFFGRAPAAVAAIVAAAVMMPAAAAAEPLQPVQVQQDWYANAGFGGFYAAQERGFYAREGLDVSLREGGGKLDSLDLLLAGDVPLSLSSSDRVIAARLAGEPVVAIATFMKRSPVVFFSLAEKNIRRPADLVGRRIRIATSLSAPLQYMMARLGYGPERYQTVILPSDPDMVLRGEGAEVWGAYASGLPVLVRTRGAEINSIYPQEYGYQGFARVLVTTERRLRQDRDMLVRFLRASVDGWRWAVENTDAVATILSKHRPDVATETLAATFDALIPFVYLGDDRIGWMDEAAWQRAIDIHREYVASGRTPELAAREIFDLGPLKAASRNGR